MARLVIVFKVFLALLAGSTVAGESLAAASEWWRTDQGDVRLVAASAAAGHADEVQFGLQFRMMPGWKIYWRSPGDAGFPPRPDWSGSKNVADARLLWPAPHRFSVLGLETLGYTDEVVLPVMVTPFEPALFATSSFWRGIDIPGEALSCLVIDKLPFAPPDEPLQAALRERDPRYFSNHALPRAILDLRQGFGRLIRRKDDRGVVVIFDRRLYTARYGPVIRRSLPNAPVTRDLSTLDTFLGS